MSERMPNRIQLPTVVHVVARLPPHVDGVGDYAIELALRARKDHGINSRFVVHDRDAGMADEIEGFPVARAPSSDPGDLCRALEASVGQAQGGLVVVHYSSYGFQENGVPEWLIAGLERFLDSCKRFRLATIFHELYATSAPWRRAFWYSGRQKELARRLLGLSWSALCTTERNEGILRGWSGQVPLTRLGIPSAINPPATLPGWDKRERRIVVFGRPHSRELVYRDPDRLLGACRRLDVEEVWDIGPRMDLSVSLAGIKRVERGNLRADEIGQCLLSSRYGYLWYSNEYLAKSSIFAAYAAHGLVAVVPSCRAPSVDGLDVDEHFLSAENMGTWCADLYRRVSRRAAQWYEGHHAGRHAAWLADRLCEAGGTVRDAMERET
jgi:hypothetical protein